MINVYRMRHNFYPTSPGSTNDEDSKQATYRLLKRLRWALFIWLISLIGAVIWFSYCP